MKCKTKINKEKYKSHVASTGQYCKHKSITAKVCKLG